MMSEPSKKTLSSLAAAPFSSAGKASSQALAPQRYNQAVELEEQLRNLLQTKGPSESHARDLRRSIRECYEIVILEDHEFAESHDVEQALWRLHYKQIEEFRARIRKSVAAVSASAPLIPMPATKPVTGTKPVPRRELFQKILAVFKSFLTEATGFYHELILKLRGKYGLPQDYLSYDDPVSDYGETKNTEIIRCQLSCHRCLIFLGDLARYKESHGDGDLRSHDWSVATNYYLKAISFWPSGGNPHNQLAALATYVNDDLLAVYRYFRSLAVDSPFLTARDNLILLFEKNRQHYAHLPAHTDETTGPVFELEASNVVEKVKIGDKMLPLGNGVLKLAVKDYNQQSTELKGLPTFISQIRRNFRVRFVRLNGIMFTRTSLEIFPDVYSATIRDLEHLLSSEDSTLEAGLGSEHRSGIGIGSSGAAGVVQLVAILIFTIHNVNWGSNAVQPTYADVLQRSALFQHAFIAAFECAGRLMRRCVDTRDVSGSPLLPAMLVFMEWLACRPELALGSDVDEKQENARSFFWKQCVSLLNRFSNYEKESSDLNASLDTPFRQNPADGFSEIEGAFALWEDYELQGFVPLAPAHLALDYSKRPSRILLGDKRERRVRIKRLIAAGKAVSNALEGSGRGIAYDEDTCKFFLAGEVRSREKVASSDVENVNGHLTPEVGTMSVDYASSRFPVNVAKETSGFVIPKGESKQTTLIALPVKQTPGEEEEEVIVFKPLLKEGSLCLSLASSKSTKGSVEVPVSSIDPVNIVTSILPSGSGDGHALAVSKESMQSACASSQTANLIPAAPKEQFEKGILGPLQASSSSHPLNSLNGFSPLALSTSSLLRTLSSSLGMTNVGLSSVHDTNFTGMHGAYSSLTGAVSAQDWLNYTKVATARGSTNAPLGNGNLQANSSMFANGFTKLPGVIGQPKQPSTNNLHWSTVPDVRTNSFSSVNAIPGPVGTPLSSVKPGAQVCMPISGMSAQVNGDSYKKPRNGVIGSPYTSMLEALASMAGANIVHSGKEGKIWESAEGYASVDSGKEGKILQSEEGYSSASPGQATSIGSSMWISKETYPSSWFGPVIRPPPGFGPLPMKSVAKVSESPQSNQCELQNQHMADMEQQQQVIDDYAWLDDYQPSKSEPHKGGCQDAVSSIYDYGILSSSNIGSDIGAPPFPGMRPSQYRNTFEQQNQNLAVQLQQQLLIEQQNRNLGLGLEQQSRLYGMQQLLGDGPGQTYAQQLLLHQQQQQHQHQLWYGHHTKDPFVSRIQNTH